MIFSQSDSLPLRRVLRGSKYTSVGSYPLFFVMADGEIMCFSCAVENRAELVRALKDPSNGHDVTQWRPYGVDVNYESALECEHCHSGIESAHGVRADQDFQTMCAIRKVTP